jgi:sugar phosphate isomerase/epimerase
MRLGAPLFGVARDDPAAWMRALAQKGYRATYCALPLDANDALCAAWERAAQASGVVTAEVGAWCNPLAADAAERSQAMEKCRQALALADRVGARCCVNISGSRGKVWMGPHPLNLTDETFDLIVASVRSIIDAVKPTRTCYTLETMQWMYPDSTDSYLRLLQAIDRPAFAVHFDPANLIVSPRTFYAIGDILRDFVQRLGPRIRSCHAKDVRILDGLAVHFTEVRPGTGGLDYRTYLGALQGLDPDLPLMIEHLPDEAEYDLAAAHIRAVAAGLGATV